MRKYDSGALSSRWRHGDMKVGWKTEIPLDSVFIRIGGTAIEEERYGKCDVYWGCHGCILVPGHSENQHKCKCGKSPTNTSVLWGEDLSIREIAATDIRQKRLANLEAKLSAEDVFDKNGNYRGHAPRGSVRRYRMKHGKMPHWKLEIK